MAIVEQFKQLGYKTESVELTPETLVAADYDTFWYECYVKAEDSYNERRARRATFAPLQGIGGTSLARMAGTFEPRPSGTDATAPDWYQILKAAGASVTTDVATWGAESTSTGVIGTSCTFKFRDGQYETTAAGTRMNLVRFYAKAGEVWKCDVEGVGRLTQAAQTSYLAAAHPISGIAQPFLGHACTIGAFSGSVSEAEIAIENTVTSYADGTHASGYGNNYITAQKLMLRAKVLETGTPDWRSLYRNDATGDAVAVSLVMSSGSAGSVLTWTGTVHLVEQPEVEYIEGIGYRNIVGEFITTGATAALTLTQS